jgi:type II secretory pathway pseudopilin PulG
MKLRLNNKGYSMVELFAVIFVVSLVLLPLLNTLVNNITTNARYHSRRSAVSIAQSTLEGFQRISFTDMETLIEAQNDAGVYYLEFDGNDCGTSGFSSGDNGLCQQLFNSTWSNFNVDAEHFKLYFYNYRMTEEIQSSLLANANIPNEVKVHIESLETTSIPNPDLYYVICWILYDDDTSSALIMEGLISSE